VRVGTAIALGAVISTARTSRVPARSGALPAVPRFCHVGKRLAQLTNRAVADRERHEEEAVSGYP